MVPPSGRLRQSTRGPVTRVEDMACGLLAVDVGQPGAWEQIDEGVGKPEQCF